MALTHDSGAVRCCAGQQAVIPPSEEPNRGAVVFHPPVLPSSPQLRRRTLAPEKYAKKWSRNALPSPFQALNSLPDASIGLCRPGKTWPYDRWLHGPEP